MTIETKNRLVYTWLWIWLLIVMAVAACIYLEIIDSAEVMVSEIPILLKTFEVKGDSWIATPLKYVVGGLFCWRAVKVFVLHGAPLNLGMKMMSGRENNVSGGRMVTLMWIGNQYIAEGNPGEFWFVAVFRAHPTSDKLMRTRLEVLVAGIPFIRRSFVIQESRFFLAKRDHLRRKEIFATTAKKYLLNSDENSF